MSESEEPVLVPCEYCNGMHEKGKVQFCPLNPYKNTLQGVEEVAPFTEHDFDKTLAALSSVERRRMLYGYWLPEKKQQPPRTHITPNLSARVERSGDQVIFLDMAGAQMIETLHPYQVVNLFLDWLNNVDTRNRLYAWERLNKEGKHE